MNQRVPAHANVITDAEAKDASDAISRDPKLLAI